MKQLDVTDLDRLKETVDESGFARTLGLTALDVAPGRASAEMVVGPQHLNMLEGTHGGALYALADHVCSLAGNSLGRRAVMSQSNVSFFRNPPVGERVLARGRVLKSGRSLGYLEVEVTDSQDRLLIKFCANFHFLEPEAP